MPIDPQQEQSSQPSTGPQAQVMQIESKMSLMDVWRTLVKQRYVILTVAIVCISAATYVAIRSPRIYGSIAKIQIKPNQSPNLGIQNLMQDPGKEENSQLETELLILQSDTVLLQTAQSMDLVTRLHLPVGVNSQSGKVQSLDDMSPIARLYLLKFIRKNLAVAKVTGTNIVQISFRSTDPNLATEFANTLVSNYTDTGLRSKYERTYHVTEWLQQQLEDLRKASVDSQQRLGEFQKSHNIVTANSGTDLNDVVLTQLNNELETAISARIMKEAKLREIQKSSSDLMPLVGDNVSLGSLKTRLTELQQERVQLAQKYGENYPKMKENKLQTERLQAEFSKEVDLAKKHTQQDYDEAKDNERTIKARLTAKEDEAFHTNEYAAQYEILSHDAELNRDLYDTLQMRLKEASVMSSLNATDISVVDKARVPIAPVAPNRAMIMMAGIFGGLFLGCVVAFVVESIDDRLQTSEEVESVSNLPALATVPHISEDISKKKKQSNDGEPDLPDLFELTALNSPKSMATEAYRSLRSALLLSSVDKPPRLIVLSSAYPGEGKTTTAVNCALVLAQRGERVLLVDGDLRRGTLNRAFAIKDKSFGLSTVLARPGQHFDIPAPLPELQTLHVLPTGPRPPNPAEMLSSQRMADQVHLWLKEYDRVVIDTAPVLAVSDTQAIAALADAVILVARAGFTRRRALVKARDLLWKINIAITGVVVNDVDMRLENFYTYRYGMYGYKYGYGYRYGASYSDHAYGFEEEADGGKND